MSKAINALKARFKDRLESEQGKPVKIETATKIFGFDAYASPVLSGMRKNKCYNALEKEGQLEFCAECMIQCLIDAAGDRVFKAGERRELMTMCDSDDISDIGAEISNVVFGTADIEKIIVDQGLDVADENADASAGSDAELQAAKKSSKKTPN